MARGGELLRVDGGGGGRTVRSTRLCGGRPDRAGPALARGGTALAVRSALPPRRPRPRRPSLAGADAAGARALGVGAAAAQRAATGAAARRCLLRADRRGGVRLSAAALPRRSAA